MNTEINFLKNVSNTEIDNHLDVILKRMYKEYEFLGNYEEYRNIFMNVLKDNIKSDINIISENKAIDILRKELKKMFRNPKYAVKTTKAFAYNKLQLQSHYEKNILELKKISDFYNSINYTPTNEVLEEIVLDPVVNNIILNILDEASELIKASGLTSFIEEKQIISIILASLRNKWKNEVYISKNAENSSRHSVLIGSSLPILTIEEEAELIKSYREGNINAKDELILRNIRLVFSVANKYAGYGLELPDLVQDGIIGLSRAIESYDYERGVKFSTYAVYWIIQSISKSIVKNSSLIRLPSYLYFKVRDAQNEYLSIDLDSKKEDDYYKIIGDSIGVKKEEVESLLLLNTSFVSLDSLIVDGSKAELASIINGNSIDPAEEATKNSLHAELKKALLRTKLNENELYVLKHRFGLDNNEIMPLEKIAKNIGVSVRGISVIASNAIKKIRCASDNFKILYDYVETKETFEQKAASCKYKKK